MKSAAMLLAMVVAVPAFAQEHWREGERRGPVVMVQRGVMQKRLADLNARLSELAARARGRDRQALRSLRESIDQMNDYLDNAPMAPRGSYTRDMFENMDADDVPPPAMPPQGQPPVVVQPPPPQEMPPQQPPRVYPINDPNLQALLGAITRESFPQDKLNVLQQAAPANWFLVAQVQQILSRFEFPRDRLQAMRLLKPRILDTDHYFQLYSSFEFPADKAELKRILSQQ